MSESKFTPGPWTQDDSHGRRFIERVGSGDTVAIVCKVDGKNGYITMNANSNLIAAAPCLLEALEGLMRVVANPRCAEGLALGSARAKATAAIRKATA